MAWCRGACLQFANRECGSDDVTTFLRAELVRLASDPDFVDAIAWHFPGTGAGQARARELSERLAALVGG